jgi:hypothetical protein
MPKDYMAPDGDDADSPQAGDGEKGESKSENTALLPKSLFAGQKLDVDSSITLKVCAIHGDEIEVCAEKADEDKPEEPGQKSSMDDAMGKIDTLAS